jgi:hypothetical protein
VLNFVASRKKERFAMATVRLIVGVAVVLLGVSATQAAWAEGPTAGNAADATGITVNSDDVRQAETSERGSDASSAADLEAKRAAMTRRSSPAITLGVTGWVGGQVIVAH